MRYNCFLIVLFFLFHIVAAQKKTPLSNSREVIKVGDQVEKVELKNLINYKSKKVFLNEFKGKLIILDLWSTSCSSCIQSWPKLLNLQEAYRDKIQIILVNPWNSESQIQKMIDRQRNMKGIEMNLPISCGDFSMSDALPSSSVPYIAWIGSDGVVKGMSGGSAMSEETIKLLLAGKNVEFNIKKDQLMPVFSEPLFIHENGGKPIWIYGQSTFARANPEMVRAFTIQSDQSDYSIYCHSTLYEMYRYAYSNLTDERGRPMRLLDGELEFEVANKAKYQKISGQVPTDSITFIYQLISKPATYKELLEQMRNDLSRYVGLKLTWEKRQKECWVMTASDTALLAYKSGFPRKVIYPTFPFQVNKVTVREFLDELSQASPYRKGVPILDETGYHGLLGFNKDGGINTDGEIDVSDYTVVNKVLSPYGLKLSLQKRDVNVLIAREVNNSDFIFDTRPTKSEQLQHDKNTLFMAVENSRYNRNWKQYVELSTKLVNTYLRDDEGQFHYVQEYCYNDAINDPQALLEALRWSKAMIDRHPDYWITNQTYAALLFKIGRNEEALAAAVRALEFGRKINDGIAPPETLDLIEKIKRSKS